MKKRGQAALEFLTTYGWAFMIILVMVGGLSYFGVLDPSGFVSDSCIASQPFSCVGTNYVVGDSGFRVQLRNTGNEALVINSLEYSHRGINEFVSCLTFTEITINRNQVVDIECSYSDSYLQSSTGRKTGLELNIGFHPLGSPSFSRQVTASLYAEVTSFSGSVPLPNLEEPNPANCPIIISELSGAGNINDPYLITTDHELQCIRFEPSNHYRLANNINLVGTNSWNSGQGFLPIGANTNQFSGSFDGAGFTIHNLYINNTQRFQGLFGTISTSGRVFNLNIQNAYVESSNHDIGILVGRNRGIVNNTFVSGELISAGLRTGMIVGHNLQGTVNNSISQGLINSTGQATGGVIGLNEGGLITRSSSQAIVIGGESVGGFIGSNENGGIITDSFSSSQINGTNFVGGFVGANFGGSSILRSSSNSNTEGDYYVGGFIGYNLGEIRDSYARGEVQAIDYVAGFAGANTQTIATSYSAARPISSGDFVYGFSIDFGPAPINSYWDTQQSQISSSSGGGSQLVTSQMTGSNAQSNMIGFDFSTIWRTTSSYPQLR